MKNYFLNRKLEQLIKKRIVDIDKQRVNSFGVLISEPFQKDLVQKQIEGLIHALGTQNCNLKYLFYPVQKNVKKKDLIKITLFGKVENMEATEFLNCKFDVLLNLCTINSLKINYLIAKSKAKFKIGFNGLDYRLFDLILQFNDFETMNQDIKTYLKAMGKI